MSSINVIEHLQEKLHKQYKNSPNINRLLNTIAVPLQDTVDVCDFLLDRKTIDEMIGFELDFVGSKIGVVRPNEQEPQEHLFTLVDEGECYDPNWETGFGDETDPTVGGYFADESGLPLVANEDQKMNDADYRKLLKQKAASFRKRATRETLFDYLIAFGARCLIDDDTGQDIVFDPIDYYALTDFDKWYAINKGFKPATISTSFRGNMRNGDSI